MRRVRSSNDPGPRRDGSALGDVVALILSLGTLGVLLIAIMITR